MVELAGGSLKLDSRFLLGEGWGGGGNEAAEICLEVFFPVKKKKKQKNIEFIFLQASHPEHEVTFTPKLSRICEPSHSTADLQILWTAGRGKYEILKLICSRRLEGEMIAVGYCKKI